MFYIWSADKLHTMLPGTDNCKGDLCKRRSSFSCFSFSQGLSWAEITWKIKLTTPPFVCGQPLGTPLPPQVSSAASPCQKTVAGIRRIRYLFLSYFVCRNVFCSPPWNSLAENKFLSCYLKDFSTREECKGCWSNGGGRNKATDLERVHLFTT